MESHQCQDTTKTLDSFGAPPHLLQLQFWNIGVFQGGGEFPPNKNVRMLCHPREKKSNLKQCVVLLSRALQSGMPLSQGCNHATVRLGLGSPSLYLCPHTSCASPTIACWISACHINRRDTSPRRNAHIRGKKNNPQTTTHMCGVEEEKNRRGEKKMKHSEYAHILSAKYPQDGERNLSIPGRSRKEATQPS